MRETERWGMGGGGVCGGVLSFSQSLQDYHTRNSAWHHAVIAKIPLDVIFSTCQIKSVMWFRGMYFKLTSTKTSPKNKTS